MKLLIITAMALFCSIGVQARSVNIVRAENSKYDLQRQVHLRAEQMRRQVLSQNLGIDNMKRDLLNKHLHKNSTSASMARAIGGHTKIVNHTLSYWGKVKRFFRVQYAATKQKYRSLRYLVSKKFKGKDLQISMLPDFPDAGIDVKEYGTGTSPEIHFFSKVDLTTLTSPADNIHWDFGDGTTVDVPILASNPYGEIVHLYSEAGHFGIQMVIKNGSTVVATLNCEAETQENTEPVPSFTLSSVSGASPFTFTMTSTATDDDGDPISLVWKIDDVEVCTTATCTKTVTDAGIHFVTLEVTDTNNVTTIGKTRFFVDTAGAGRPVAVLSANTRIGYAPLTVQFDAGKSFDPMGLPLNEIYWDFNEKDKALGNEPFTASATRTFTRPGTYWVYLEVGNSNSRYDEILVPIYVLDPTPQPSEIIAFQNGPLEVYFDSGVNSLRSAAHDSGFYWDFGDGSTYVGRYPDHVYSSAGTYTVTLNTVDVRGNTFTTSKSITVGSSFDNPNAVASLSTYLTPIYTDVTFDSSGSSDPQSHALSYRWTFGDDGYQTTTTDSSITHAFNNKGVVPFELIATNTRGISQRTSWYLQATDGAVLTAAMNFDPKVGSGPSLEVNFDGTPTKSVDGNPIFHDWVDGGGYSFSNDAKATYYFGDGDGYFTHFVRDSIGNESVQGDHVTVYTSGTVPGGNLPPTAVITSFFDSDNKTVGGNCLSSTDPDDSVTHCEWKLNGVKLPDTGMYIDAVPLVDGQVNTLELTAIDTWGATGVAYAQFDLTASGAPTLTSFDYEPALPILTDDIIFGADKSSVESGSIKKFEWDFGDSSSAIGIQAHHTYSSAGTYTVTLTTTDESDVTRTISKSVVVASAAPTPTLSIVATDPSLSGHVLNDGTFRADRFPVTIRFKAEASNSSHGGATFADWSFGSLGEAKGREAEFTFNQPGTYTVDASSSIDSDVATASMTVVVPEDPSCRISDEQTTCLRLVGVNQGVLPMSAKEWTIENAASASLSTSSSDLIKNWIYLKALDGSDDQIDLSDAVTVSGSQIKLSQAGLISKNINLDRSYKLVISTHNTSGDPLVAEWPQLSFASASIDLTALETGVLYQIVNTENQLHQYYYMDSGLEHLLTDMPSGYYAVSAIGPTWVDTFPIYASANKTTTVLASSADALTRRKNKRIIAKKDLSRIWKLEELKYPGKMSVKGNENLPSWANSLCGETSPFTAAPPRLLGEGVSSTMSFSSYDPLAQSSYAAIPASSDRMVHLSCKVASAAMTYAQNKWKYKEGPRRCSGDNKPHPYWNEYLKSLIHVNDPIIISYQIRDAWSGDMQSGSIATSSRMMMAENGHTIEDMTSRIGLGVDDGGDWGQRSEYEIAIPKQYARPEIRFEMQSTQESGIDSFYQIECDVLKTDDSPKIAHIQTPSMDADPHTVERNAALTIQKEYGFFPVQYDDRTHAAISEKSDAAKAKYEIKIQPNGRSDITWQSVELQFLYAGQSFTHTYDLLDAGSTDSTTGLYTNTILVDTADLKDKFEWQQGFPFVEIKFTPIGKVSVDGDFRGSAKTLRMIALFDAQTVHDQQFEQVCPNGFYPTEDSSFARDELLSAMMKGGDKGFRCGDISAPFGGPFELSSTWKHYGHQAGESAYVRPMGDTTYDQDNNHGSQNLSDVNSYLTFASDSAAVLSDSTAMGNIFAFCHDGANVLPPCTASMTSGDLNQDLVMEICQWYTDGYSTVPSGCPTVPITRFARIARWVELNSKGWVDFLNETPTRMSISSGYWLAASVNPQDGWQRDALMKGIWPDGRPIWKKSASISSADDLVLTNEKAVSCSTPDHECSALTPSFTNSNAYIDNMLISTGWK